MAHMSQGVSACFGECSYVSLENLVTLRQTSAEAKWGSLTSSCPL